MATLQDIDTVCTPLSSLHDDRCKLDSVDAPKNESFSIANLLKLMNLHAAQIEFTWHVKNLMHEMRGNSTALTLSTLVTMECGDVHNAAKMRLDLLLRNAITRKSVIVEAARNMSNSVVAELLQDLDMKDRSRMFIEAIRYARIEIAQTIIGKHSHIDDNLKAWINANMREHIVVASIESANMETLDFVQHLFNILPVDVSRSSPFASAQLWLTLKTCSDTLIVDYLVDKFFFPMCGAVRYKMQNDSSDLLATSYTVYSSDEMTEFGRAIGINEHTSLTDITRYMNCAFMYSAVDPMTYLESLDTITNDIMQRGMFSQFCTYACDFLHGLESGCISAGKTECVITLNNFRTL